MAAWALRDAKDSFETIFERAWNGEPQTVVRDGKTAVVVVSLSDYSAERANKSSLLDTLRSCPCGDELAACIEESRSDSPSYFERIGGFSDEDAK